MAGLQWTGRLDPFGIDGLSSGDEGRGGDEPGSESSGVPFGIDGLSSGDEGRGGDGPGSGSSGLAFLEHILDPATNERADSSPLFSGANSPTSPRYTPSSGSSMAGLIEHAQSDDGAAPSDGRHDRIVHAPSGG